VHHHPYHSDHYPILLQTGLPVLPPSRPPRWNLAKANWTSFRSSLKLPSTFLSPSEACSVVEGRIKSAASCSVPRSAGHSKRKQTHHWWTATCTSRFRDKQKALHNYQRHQGSIILWIEYKKSRAIFIHTTRTARKDSWLDFICTISIQTCSSEVWRALRRLRCSPPHKAIVLREGDDVTTDPGAVADLLAKDFSSRGVSGPPKFMAHRFLSEQSPIIFQHSSTPFYNEDFNITELDRAVASVSSTSPGPDDIPYDFIKQFNPAQLKNLLSYYNFLWHNGLPHQWKYSIVLPIPKPGKPSHITSSYRPIALTNCMCKLMEKLVNSRLQQYLTSHRLIDPHQSGFRMGHSTLDAVMRLESEVRTRFIQGDMVMAVFLDITQAFDSVWHYGVLSRVSSFGISGNLACFIRDFLANRRISTRVGSSISSAYPVSSGVPQGSVLSPTLFTLMLNDLFSSCKDVSYSLYADDCALWVGAHTVEACTAAVQTALDTVSTWSSTWGLQFSPAKSKAMLFTRNRNVVLPLLQLNGDIVNFVPHYKFLGVTFDRQLSWRNHIFSLRDRCKSDIRLMSIVSAQGWGADFPTLRRMYLQLTRPKLDYASFLFQTSAPSYLKELDRIQYAAARVMLGALRCTKVCNLEVEAHLMPLSLTRQLGLSRYVSRILTIPHHPCRTLLLSYYHFQFYQQQPLPLPSAGRAYVEFQALGIPFSSIPVIPLTCRLTTYSLPVHASLVVAQKSSLSSAQWRTLYADLVKQYPSHIAVFTDGSLRGDLRGAGAWTSAFSLQARLPSSTSIFTTELYAIFMTLTYLSTYQGRFIVFTDSLSSVRALQCITRSSHYLVYKIAELLCSPSPSIQLEWVPSHQGIPGNENADEQASQACLLPQSTSIALPLSDFRNLVVSHYLKLWQQHWTALNSRLFQYTPEIGVLASHMLPRRDQIVCTRLRLHTSRFTHKHYFTKEPQPYCSTCDIPLTIPHVLLHCPDYSAHRPPLNAACRELTQPLTLATLLNPEFPHETLLHFLRESGVYSRI
jgi:ribonuclease HI